MTAMASPSHAVESTRQWKATPARPYVLRGTQRRLLDRAEQFLADEQWEDAVAALMRLLEPDNFSLVALDAQHYVSLQEYCHRRLAQLPVEPLAHYRALVDATAESGYRHGIENRDQTLLQHVVDKYFCSHWGDEALFALGELALQRGEYQAARNAWLRISPLLGSKVGCLTYPDTNLSLAAVQARLVLVSLREGDWQRAESELAALRANDLAATGKLGGREVVLAEHLTSLLKQARQWPASPAATGWRTFAANSQRTNARIAPPATDSYGLLWSQPLANEQLAIFPVVVNGLLVYQDATSVHTLRLIDGEKKFRTQGGVFRSPSLPAAQLGQLRHTLTATDRFLFGVTTATLGLRGKSKGTDVQSTLWSLDLRRDGALTLRQTSEDANVAFVGAPVVEGTRIFVPIRSNDQTARAGIACYDLSTGQRWWQRWLCQANTPATGWANEIVGNLLTYDAGILYANTNLGAIAAVRANDGQVVWLHTYERKNVARKSTVGGDYYRGPNPCVYHRGVILALPTDSKSLFALDATTGKELWRHEANVASMRAFGVQENRVVLFSESGQNCDLRTGVRLGKVDTAWGKLPFQGPANCFFLGETLVAAGPSLLSVFRHQPRAPDSPKNTQTSSQE